MSITGSASTLIGYKRHADGTWRAVMTWTQTNLETRETYQVWFLLLEDWGEGAPQRSPIVPDTTEWSESYPNPWQEFAY